MPCIDCSPVKLDRPQRAVSWKAWYIGWQVYAGGPEDWPELPADGLLAVKVYFDDNTARICSGNDWYGLMVAQDGNWTIIHNDNTDNKERYPEVDFKRGKWTSEAEMQAVNKALLET